eukprot:6003594-Pyramimonas_sp.AAC.1
MPCGVVFRVLVSPRSGSAFGLGHPGSRLKTGLVSRFTSQTVVGAEFHDVLSVHVHELSGSGHLRRQLLFSFVAAL